MSAFLFLCYHLKVGDSLPSSCTCLVPPRLAFQLFAGQTISLLFLDKEQRMNLVNLKFGEVVTLHKGRWNDQ